MSQLQDRAEPRQQAGAVNLAVVRDPVSPLAEAYRSLRATVKFADVEPPVRTLLIADAGTGGRHRDTAANLAAALALGGDSVALVDADLRQPRLHEFFGVPNQTGLGEWLASGLAGPLPLVPAGLPGLLLLPAGHPPATGIAAADLLSSDRLSRLLAQLRDEATFVVVDAPPLPDCADALPIAAQVDATLLLVRSGKTKRVVAQRGKEALDRVGARILGVVLTDTGRRWGRG